MNQDLLTFSVVTLSSFLASSATREHASLIAYNKSSSTETPCASVWMSSVVVVGLASSLLLCR